VIEIPIDKPGAAHSKVRTVSVPAASSASDPRYSAAHAAMRASDADRDRVAEVLREAYAEGRIDAEEHTERVDLAYKAKTLGELAPLLADLPARHDLRAGGRTVPQSGPAVPTAYTDPKVAAVFGSATRDGRWVVPPQTTVAAIFGEVTIDLREAVLAQREVVIIANAVFGQVTVKVPHGVLVRDEGTAIFGSRDGVSSRQAGDLPVTADTPVVVVRGVALFGEVSVKYPKQGKMFRRG
jgi:hypothetical protein